MSDIYSVEDVYDLIEIILIDNHNKRVARKASEER